MNVGGPDNPTDDGADAGEPEHVTLADQVEAALAHPPVGLLLIGWQRTGDPAEPYEQRVEQAIVFTATSCARQSDVVAAATHERLAVVRAALDAPAATEGLAHRIVQRLDAELEIVATNAGRDRVRWAVGAAIGYEGDGADDLLRYANLALDDAWARGGHRLVAFDDTDRDLLGPAIGLD